MTEPTSFGTELERLEAIVRKLEAEELDLDDALALFEEGVRHLKAARTRLVEADRTVKRVIAEAGDAYREEDVDL